MRLILLHPFIHAARHRFFPRGRPSLKAMGLFLLCLVICLVLYSVALKVVTYFHGQNELGIILSLKIFQMAWIILFAMLVFSNMVAGMSALFLSQDTEIILSAPVPLADIFFMRTLTTGLQTSWMMVLFCLPIFLAYGQVFAAGPLYPVLLTMTLLATALIAACLAMLLTVILVTLFPARRTKDIILYLSLCFGIFIYVIFRLLKPEDLVNPDKFGQFVDYLSTISTPAGPYLPAAWAANLLSLYLTDHEIDYLLAGLLCTMGPSLFFAGEVAMQRWFISGHTKSQESFGGLRRFGDQAHGLPGIWPQLAAKEIKTFLRDSAEWSQLFMIGALVVVYLYNFKLLPMDRAYIRQEYLANLIAFLNIGLSTFLILSLAARFVFPSIGGEGGAFGILRAAPISMTRFLIYKYCCHLPPFTLLALLLVIVSNRMLGVSGPIWWLSISATLLLTWTILAMALGFGAWHADFRAPNRAAAVGSLGGMLFLFAAMIYELLFIGLTALPAYRLTKHWLQGLPWSTTDLVSILLWTISALASTIGLTWFWLRFGAGKLESLER